MTMLPQGLQLVLAACVHFSVPVDPVTPGATGQQCPVWKNSWMARKALPVREL
jgi:hypothetical protein